MDGEAIVRFDPETGKVKESSANVTEWAEKILADYNVITGYPVAQEWQKKHRVLEPGERLIPTQLFTLGGGYKEDNFYAMDALNSMEYRADMYDQLHGLPDGQAVVMKVV